MTPATSPHCGLPASSQKSTYPEEVNLERVSNTNSVTIHPDSGCSERVCSPLTNGSYRLAYLSTFNYLSTFSYRSTFEWTLLSRLSVHFRVSVNFRVDATISPMTGVSRKERERTPCHLVSATSANLGPWLTPAQRDLIIGK
jgi:hypothetical protein